MVQVSNHVEQTSQFRRHRNRRCKFIHNKNNYNWCIIVPLCPNSCIQSDKTGQTTATHIRQISRDRRPDRTSWLPGVPLWQLLMIWYQYRLKIIRTVLDMDATSTWSESSRFQCRMSHQVLMLMGRIELLESQQRPPIEPASWSDNSIECQVCSGSPLAALISHLH